ncbi:hypothetical protein B0H17DRAFT_1123654 [Mycena rosella]|uniref:Uncharacterized protein n=1 Tax=Mycena rosella TaxID=1033263 RepID=A0AAD7H2Q8_MYCRO|nr:hypothetical protein B0H17DRAFT_1123654 [Mycena rosella]
MLLAASALERTECALSMCGVAGMDTGTSIALWQRVRGGNGGGGGVLMRDANAEDSAVIQVHEAWEAASWRAARAETRKGSVAACTGVGTVAEEGYSGRTPMRRAQQ